MTAPAPYRSVAPYRSQAGPGRDGFPQLLHAEWTKFRTVRGWIVGIIVAGLLTVGVSLLYHGECGTMINGTQTAGCPGTPIGPGGEAVIDSFYFVHQPLAGDGTITVRVASLTGRYPANGGVSPSGNPLAGYLAGVQPWAKTGIMIKASTTPGAAYAAMLVTGGNGVRMQYDYTGDVAGLPGAVTASSPRWLRLVRSGGTITGYDSLDGARWTQVGAVSLPGLSSTAQVGLFTASPTYEVYSQSAGHGGGTGGPTLATATFSSLAASWPAGTWAGTSVGAGGGSGSPGPAGLGNGPSNPFYGGYKQAAGTFTVSGSGDIAPNVPDGPDGVGISPTRAIETGTFFALIAMVIIGAVFITAEYRRGLIRTTLTASSRRGRVLAAKAVVLAVVTFAVGLIGTAIALPAGESKFRNGGYWVPPLSGAATVRMIVGTAAVMAIASVLALALGVVVRRGVAAVSTVIVLIVLPFLFAVIPGLLPLGAEDWLLRIFPAGAFAVQQAFPAYHQVLGQYLPGNGYYPLSWWAGLLVLCAWTVIALAAAASLLNRRDA
jgi:ABC-type transport system involved in multi-copper enzyme maturation permease subunit